MVKKKLTLSIDEDIIEHTKRKAQERGISISKIVENALRFFVDPHVYCFSCGHRFETSGSEVCTRCGWYKCPKCGSCACSLGDEGAKVAFYMRRTLIDIFQTSEV